MPAFIALRATVRFLAVALFACATTAFSADLPPAESLDGPTPAYRRSLEITNETREELAAGNIDRLEAIAAQLRASKERLDGGGWLLSSYYWVLAKMPDEEQDQAGRIAFLEKWVAERPQSITARVALAWALTRYAWKARGSGTNDTVSDEGWRLFGERLDQARVVLDEAKKLKEQCPGWYEAAQSVALGQGWDPDEYFALVDEAIGREPTYGAYYSNACYWMLPRWHGEEGEFEAWITGLADKSPEGERDRRYAALVWSADLMAKNRDMVFAEGRLDWERTKKGFQEWIAREPDNLMVRFVFTRLAVLADDRETAREQFDFTGGRYFPRIWTPASFEAARRYAYEGGPNPLIPKKTVERKGPRFDFETIRNIRIGVHVLLALAGGFLAGFILLIIAWQRKEVWAGVIAVFVAVFASLPFGTIGSLAAGVGLWVYLRCRPARTLDEGGRFSPWMTLAGVICLAVAYLGMQVMAVIPAMIPYLLEMGPSQQAAAVERLMANGQAERIAISAAWLVVLGAVAVCGSRVRIAKRLGLSRPGLKASLLWTPVFLIVIAAMGYAVDRVLDARSMEALKLMQMGRHSPATFILSLCLFAPLAEELIFRGYAYSGWIRSMGWWLTALVSSLIFALLHIQYGWVGLVYVFVLGMLLALLRRLSGSVIPCIVLHSAANAVFVISSFVSPLG
ncbi:membrane protease YdiL, CAAX protease family [Terrimicrobium sacchariphilum]|uniref:Membrane protease YdiL, CAAX protease family n=1 Tax=Terrimicrobium sacchariphilum TaxID=690879 RepID=A0A146G519_TERSA|nr:CPBP family glutamic-type intramembrane protease [Terrimicrobium sacchariphilum]GAT32865.1 membrane protease YdiL, CAAX protease family [Terrimicrobium sacchariphilum]